MKYKPTYNLDKAGKELFQTIVAYLEERDAMEDADLSMITTAAAIGSRIVKYEAIVAKQGEVEEYSNGNTGFSTAYKVLVQERAEFSRYMRALGITATGRKLAGIRSGKKQQADPAIYKLLNIAK